jgi:NADP-dependent 3-hydroxy acid dehydrogenase YdfG
MTRNIEGKVVVITGASSGLGVATARLLSSEGAVDVNEILFRPTAQPL